MIWRILQIQLCVLRLIGTNFHIHTKASWRHWFLVYYYYFFHYILRLKTFLPRSMKSSRLSNNCFFLGSYKIWSGVYFKMLISIRMFLTWKIFCYFLELWQTQLSHLAFCWPLLGRKSLDNNDQDQVLWARETEYPTPQTLIFTKTAGRWLRSLLSKVFLLGWPHYWARLKAKQARSYPIRIDHFVRVGTKEIPLTILQFVQSLCDLFKFWFFKRMYAGVQSIC